MKDMVKLEKKLTLLNKIFTDTNKNRRLKIMHIYYKTSKIDLIT